MRYPAVLGGLPGIHEGELFTERSLPRGRLTSMCFNPLWNFPRGVPMLNPGGKKGFKRKKKFFHSFLSAPALLWNLFFYRSSHHIPLLSNPPKRGTFFFNPRPYLFQPIPYPPKKNYNGQATTTAKWKECVPPKTKMTLENHHFQSLEIHHFQIGCCSILIISFRWSISLGAPSQDASHHQDSIFSRGITCHDSILGGGATPKVTQISSKTHTIRKTNYEDHNSYHYPP